MGRTLSGSNDEKEEKQEKSSKKTDDVESDTSDEVEEELDEEHFIVEKILKMRTTKKGKVQCKHKFPCKIHPTFFFFFYYRSTEMERFFP